MVLLAQRDKGFGEEADTSFATQSIFLIPSLLLASTCWPYLLPWHGPTARLPISGCGIYYAPAEVMFPVAIKRLLEEYI